MSLIEQSASALDIDGCTRDLIHRVRSCLEKAGGVDKFKGELAEQLGMDPSRIDVLLNSAEPNITRSEVNALCLATSITLDSLFDLPDLEDENVVKAEYDELVRNEGNAQLFAAGRTNSESFSNIDAMRSILYLRYLQMCLDRYPRETIEVS